MHPFAPSYRNTQLSSILKQHENRKKSEYGQRIQEIEHGCFSPLVLTTTGSMAKEATAFYQRLASLISDHRNEKYSTVMGWIRCRISFSLLRSALLCIRGSKSVSRNGIQDFGNSNITLAKAESKFNSLTINVNDSIEQNIDYNVLIFVT